MRLLALLLLSFTANAFEAFDASNFSNPHAYLGAPVDIIYENQIVSTPCYGVPPVESEVKANLLNKYTSPPARLIIDIECWKLLDPINTDPNADAHVLYYMQVLNWAREVLPGTDLGYFGLPHTSWEIIGKPQNRPAYEEMINRLLPVLNAVDTVYPAFYVEYDSPKKLDYNNAIHLQFARTTGKPVMPFVWHRGPGANFNNELLPTHLVNQQCDFIRSFADGVIMWSISTETWGNAWWYAHSARCLLIDQ